jgi:putative peptide zinc metalloprotease protein
MTEAPRLFANPLLEASDFDSDAGQPMVLCVVPSAKDPVRFAIPASYMDLVREFDGERTEEEAIDAFLDRHPDRFEREWLRRLVRQSLLAKGILVHADQDPACVAVSTQPKRAFLYLKLPIFPPSLVEPVAQSLSFMFKRPPLLLGLLLAVVAHAYVYGVLLHEQHVDFNRLDAASVLLILLLSTLATICHEFGHASAAAHYGCRRMSIGWGLYIVYTVFWTNVSEAWKLPRRQRAMIDIGGVYFESIFMLLLLALYMKTGNLVFLFAFVFMDLSLLTTLNPFLRMDGYWLFSDLFGIVNLRKQQTEWMGEVASKLFGSGTYVKRSSLSRRAKWALGIYSVAGVVFLIYLVTVILQFVVLNVAGQYPALLQEYWRDAASGMSALQLLAGFVEIFWRTLMLGGAGFLLVLLATRATRLVARIGLFRPAVRQSSI